MNVTIYHNPRCSKSRQTLDLLRERGLEPRIIEYLTDPPDPDTLHGLLGMLQLDAAAVMRTGEEEYRNARTELDEMTDADRIAWLCAHPKVLQRPIVVAGKQARIGRPPESVLEILS